MLKEQKGLTILETMIVITIVAGVFLAFFMLFHGIARRESLKKGTDTLVANINDVLNDISTGSFYDIEGVRCSAKAGGTGVEYSVDSTARPGYYDECVFLGKVIQLGEGGSVGETVAGVYDGAGEFNVYTVIGLAAQLDNSGSTRGAGNYPNLFVFRNETAAPNFDSSVYGYVRDAEITAAYVWADKNNDDKPNWPPSLGDEEVIFIDGFAVMLEGFGGVRGGSGNRFILGSSRDIDLQTNYLTANQHDSQRSRPSDDEAFIDRIEGHDAASNQYFHRGDTAAQEIIICLRGTGGRSYVRVSSVSGLAAEAVFAKEKVADMCIPT